MSGRVVSSVLVARERELDVMLDALDRARAGEAVVVLVAGEAGVGKSRLIEETATRAGAAGVRVLTGACVELGGEALPFAPLVDALRELERTSSAPELARVLGNGRAELAQLLPQLDPRLDHEGTPTGPEPREVSPARLFEHVLGVVTRLAAAAPLMLVFEDLHWADRSTLDLVTFLVRSLGAGPVLVVATYRIDELHRRHPLRPVLVELERLRQVRVLELNRFDVSGVRTQLANILGETPPDDLTQRVFDRSGGNAFLTEEALELARSGNRLSSSLRELLVERVEQLAESTQEVMRVVALAGRRVEHRLLEQVAAVGVDALHSAAREAVENHVLTVDEAGRGYAFRHALVREAVADDILPGETVAIHTAYARALEAEPALAGSATAAAGEIAYHWYGAHDLPRALPSAIHAARAASGAYAYSEASRLLSRALEIWPAVPDAKTVTGLDHCAVLELAIGAARAEGDEDRALALVDQALAEVDVEADPVRAALLWQRRGLTLAFRDPEAALRDLVRASELVPADPPSTALASILADVARTEFFGNELGASRATAERALRVAREVHDQGSEIAALITLGSALGYNHDIDAGVRMLREAVDLGRVFGDDVIVLRAMVNLADLLGAGGRHAEAVESAVEGVEFAARVGLARSWGSFAAGNAAESLLRLGQLDAAFERASAALQLGPTGVFAANSRLVLAEIAMQRGRFDELETHLDAVRAQFEGTDPGFQYELPLALLAAEAHRARNDHATARAELDAVLDRDDADSGSERYVWPVLALAARIALDAAETATGPDERARPDRYGAIAAGLSADAPPAVAYAANVVAEIARVGATTDAVAAWTEAVARWRETAEPYPLAAALIRLGESSLRADEPDRAAVALLEARRIAQRLGATPLVTEAERFARDAGVALELDPDIDTAPAPAQPSTDAPLAEIPGAPRLTARETEVLALVAEGCSNSQIAAQLYISAKTASVHVSNILAKLGVQSRGEAAAIAHRLHLFDTPPSA